MAGKNRIYQTVTIFTESSLQSSLLKDALEQALDISIDIIPVKHLSLLEFPEKRVIGDIIIADMSVLTEELQQEYFLCQQHYFSGKPELLINCDKECNYADLKGWSNLVGVFYTIDDIKLLSTGIGKVLTGEMWFSRKLAQEYIQNYRKKNSAKTTVAYNQLTKREQQIIKLLGNGDSNVEIAEKLFISENTVKTHLHNVFKKIKAKNRLQALIWAKENIGIEELS